VRVAAGRGGPPSESSGAGMHGDCRRRGPA
jgi:hypothetical protein